MDALLALANKIMDFIEKLGANFDLVEIVREFITNLFNI